MSMVRWGVSCTFFCYLVTPDNRLDGQVIVDHLVADGSGAADAVSDKVIDDHLAVQAIIRSYQVKKKVQLTPHRTIDICCIVIFLKRRNACQRLFHRFKGDHAADRLTTKSPSLAPVRPISSYFQLVFLFLFVFDWQG
jgi:hypothetical protein